MRTVVAATCCDLCGYGGAYSRAEDFVSNGGFDFCRWCANQPATGRLESGGHSVTLPGDGSWSCTCGRTYSDVVTALRLHGVSLAAMDSVPGNFAGSIASLHVNTPNWPKTTL